jgi:hypothetical protein
MEMEKSKRFSKVTFARIDGVDMTIKIILHAFFAVLREEYSTCPMN